MNPSAPVSFDDLNIAFEWVSSPHQCENVACVSRLTGKVHWRVQDEDDGEELPDDIDDSDIYVDVPHKADLDLGKQLAFDFTRQHMAQEYDSVRDAFRRPGAYARFKALLDRHALLQTWYDFEAKATEQALREWAEAKSLTLAP